MVQQIPLALAAIVAITACSSSSNTDTKSVDGSASTTGGAAGLGGTVASGGASGDNAGGPASGGHGDGGVAGRAGAGGAAGSPNVGKHFQCGSDTCVVGTSYCLTTSGGLGGPGATSTTACGTIPASCAQDQTCACLCPMQAPGQSLLCIVSPTVIPCSCSIEGGEVR